MLKKESLGIQQNLKTQELDYSIYKYSFKEYLKYVIFSLGIIILFNYAFYKNFYICIISSMFSLAYPLMKKKKLIKKQKNKLLLEFKEAILILSALLSAGYSLENSIKESLNELKVLFGEKSLIVLEFDSIYKKTKLNISVEYALEDLAKRSHLEEIENLASVIKFAKRNGGSLIDIFNHSIRVIGDKISVKEEISTLISSKVYEQKIMNLFPLIIIVYLNISSGEYFKFMYETILGKVCMSICLIFYISALVLSEKLMDIKI